MDERDLLSLLARAFEAADHPEIAGVSQFDNPYGGCGVGVKFTDGSGCWATSHGRPEALAPAKVATTSAR
jgi:hypothetical protein